MKKILLTLAITIAFGAICSGNPVEKRYNLYGVAFYNLENLFDTLHDAGKNDYEFLPDGKNHWGT
ncbi:MAG: endonuclease/exonuclease/phosphatase family protein, partial [Bacteroidaceae bacterium]|nr:endonuclease/exonuclease/phosphatase family protein [Bacteroidaceae bacterium]